jgi:RNA polymerase sigma-70 factor, ECF subfamily
VDRSSSGKPPAAPVRVQDVLVEQGVEFEAFFREEHARLVALGAAMTGDVEVARELAQEAFVRAHHHWDEVSTLDAPAAWLRRVAVNLSIDHVRRRRREHAAIARLAPAAASTAPGADDPVSREWWRAVRALPDRQRAVVTLYYVEDCSVADVAAILGIAEGTVKATLSKARDSLRRSLVEVR